MFCYQYCTLKMQLHDFAVSSLHEVTNSGIIDFKVFADKLNAFH